MGSVGFKSEIFSPVERLFGCIYPLAAVAHLLVALPQFVHQLGPHYLHLHHQHPHYLPHYHHPSHHQHPHHHNPHLWLRVGQEAGRPLIEDDVGWYLQVPRPRDYQLLGSGSSHLLRDPPLDSLDHWRLVLGWGLLLRGERRRRSGSTQTQWVGVPLKP